MTRLQNLDTEEDALLSALDFSTSGQGGSMSVSGITAKLDYIQKRRLQLRRELFQIDGGKGLDQQRTGIDFDKTNDNDDI